MNKILYILGIIFILTSCASVARLFKVDNSKVGVKYKRVKGTIFNDEYDFSNFFVIDVDSTKRWTPKKVDIENAESILRRQLSNINKDKVNQFGGYPIIHRNLNSYFRQYVGILNEKGQKIIHINFYWNKYSLIDKIKGYHNSRINFKSNYAIVFDGGSYYWQINVNLEEQKLSDLQINGVA